MATIKVPSWLGNVEFRRYENRKDLYDEIGLKYVRNYPHTEVAQQLEMFYIVEYEPTKSNNKIGFRVIGLTPLGEIALEMREQLKKASGSSLEKITFFL